MSLHFFYITRQRFEKKSIHSGENTAELMDFWLFRAIIILNYLILHNLPTQKNKIFCPKKFCHVPKML